MPETLPDWPRVRVPTVGVPVISVVIPTYKHRDYIVKSLESVWKQTFQDYEIIVVNDGSPDDTHEILAPYVESGNIHHYIRQDNAGQSAARNRGIAASRGEFIALLDDDDQWPADKLEWQWKALQENPQAAVVYGLAVPVGEDGKRIEKPLDAYGNVLPWPWTAPGGRIHRELASRNWLISPGQAMIRRSKLSNPPFDPRLWGCDDWDLWLRLAENNEFIYRDQPALLYRLHQGNASQDTLRMRQNDFLLLRKHLFRSVIAPQRLRYMAYWYWFYWKWTPGWLLQQADQDMDNHRTSRAQEKLRYALQFRPWMLVRAYYRNLNRRAREQAAQEKTYAERPDQTKSERGKARL